VCFTFVNLIKKNQEKQINLIKKVVKKNASHKLSVKNTFKYYGFVKKTSVFRINLCKIYTLCEKTNISTKNNTLKLFNKTVKYLPFKSVLI
jgi:lipopolysaccharide assembly outer membrane protein LptD (OstA)